MFLPRRDPVADPDHAGDVVSLSWLENLTIHLEIQEVVVCEESWPFLLRLLS